MKSSVVGIKTAPAMRKVFVMRKAPALGLMTATMVALAGCTAGGVISSPPASGTATASASATPSKVFSEDELRALISGLKDADGSELRLYSKEQVDQGGNIADLLLGTATVTPANCKDIATAGLMDVVESGAVAVAISDSSEPRTLSAQSGDEGPDAVEVLTGISGMMSQCATFSVEALGQRYDVSSEELQADTDAQKTFATLSTRAGQPQQELMQVSGAEGRLLVVATKGGADLGEPDREELEELINAVLRKAEGGTGTASPTSSGTPTSTTSASPSATRGSASPTVTITVTSSPTPTP